MAKKKNQDSKTYAFIATFLSIIGFIIALLAWKDDKYVMHYAKQSLVIFIIGIIAGMVFIIPILGWVAGAVLYVAYVIFWFMSWINALSGEMKDIKIVSDFTKKIDL